MAKACPPPRRTGVRLAPARARPVPFCLYIFFVLPATIPRDLDCIVPTRLLASYITTTSCSNCLLIPGASRAGSNSYEPTSAPVLSLTGIVILSAMLGILRVEAVRSGAEGQFFFFLDGVGSAATRNRFLFVRRMVT